MGMLTKYFLAPSSDVAAGTLARGPQDLPTLNGRRELDANVGLDFLDEALTGRTHEEIRDDETANEFVDPDGRPCAHSFDPSFAIEATVGSINLTLQDALAAASEAELRDAVARAMAQLDPRDQPINPDFVVELGQFVREGRDRGDRLYVWESV